LHNPKTILNCGARVFETEDMLKSYFLLSDVANYFGALSLSQRSPVTASQDPMDATG
jgi:hypothetical protein